MMNDDYNEEYVGLMIDSIVDEFITKIYGEYGYIKNSDVIVAAGHRSNFVKIKSSTFEEMIYNGVIKRLSDKAAGCFRGVTIDTKYVGCGYIEFPIEGVYSTEFEAVHASIDDDAPPEVVEQICDEVERTFYELLNEVEELYDVIQTAFWDYIREVADE